MQITFKHLDINYFKNIEKLETDFGNKTLIYGANETGKTTIADAISWVLTGKNSLGESQFTICSISKKWLSPTVTLTLNMNTGKETKQVVLERIYQAKQNKAKEFTGEYQTVCVINGLKTGPKEFSKWIDEHICNPEVFRLIHDVRYFTENIITNGRERLWEAQRRLLFSVCGIKSDSALMSSKKQFEPLKNEASNYDDISQYLEYLKGHLKTINTTIENHNFELNNVGTYIGTDIDSKIAELTAQIEAYCKGREDAIARDKAENDKQDVLYRKARESYKLKHNEYMAKLNELSDICRRARDDYTGAVHLSQVCKSEIANLEKEQRDVAETDTCPTCGQKLSRKDIISAVHFTEAKITKAKEALKEQEMICERRTVAIREYKRKVDELCKLEPQAPSAPAPVYSHRDKWESEDKQKLFEAEKELAILTGAKKYYDKQKTVESDIKSLAAKRADLARKIDLCKDFTDYKCRLATKKINDMFDGVRFELFRQNKTNDEIKDCCDIFWNGVLYASLSYSTKFVVSLKIALAFQKFYGVTMPIIIDNAESIDLMQDLPVQSIMMVKRDELCECGGSTERKESDELWTCKKCGKRFMKTLEIVTEA